MLTRKTQITAKVESAYGTDPTPAASDAILVSPPDVKVNGEVLNRDFVRSYLSPVGPIIGKQRVDISFETELKGDGGGTAGVAPEVSPLWQACGMDETISASTSVTYAPEAVSTAVKSCTIWVYLDGTIHKVTGCRGSFNINLEAGMIPKIQWTFQGEYATPTDLSLLASPVFDAAIPVAVKSANFAIDGYSAKINALQYDIGNTIAAPGNVNEPTGYGEFQITARASTGSIDPEAQTIAVLDAAMTANFWDDWEAGQGRAMTVTVGTVASNIVDIDWPNVILSEMGYGEREGIRTYQMPFVAAGSSGDDEVSIVYT